MKSRKKIEENWATIEGIELKVRELKGDPEAGFNADTWWFNDVGRQKLALPCLYRNQKVRNGKSGFTKSYKEIMMYATFCPFTGLPLYSEEESE